jgi:hypothetical protein
MILHRECATPGEASRGFVAWLEVEDRPFRRQLSDELAPDVLIRNPTREKDDRQTPLAAAAGVDSQSEADPFANPYITFRDGRHISIFCLSADQVNCAFSVRFHGQEVGIAEVEVLHVLIASAP